MSMSGELALSTGDETIFAELTGGQNGFAEAEVVTSGLTSVLERARATAQDLTAQSAAGISDINGGVPAFQSAFK